VRELDLYREVEHVSRFISGYVGNTRCVKVVVGLSGGIDSSLSAALCVKALGRDNVLGVLLPYRTSHRDSAADALLLAKSLSIATETIDISPMVDAYFCDVDLPIHPLRKGNFMARMRMSVLYDLSAKHQALVVGTCNRTELLVGYFTQFGDGASAFEPIGHLYKTEVWKMAKLLGVPETIISKTPTADLWEGQTDEQELGISYPVLDEILYELTELDMNPTATENLTHPQAMYDKVNNLIRNSEFKRHPAPIPELD